MNMVALDDGNYERWKICLRSYFVSKDLWEVIVLNERPTEVDEKEWTKTDAAALHAIQISCGEKSFEQIKHINSAKCAWNKLAKMHTNEEESVSQEDIPAIPNLDRTGPIQQLEDAIENAKVDVVRELLNTPNANNSVIVSEEYTALHLAVYLGQTEIVEALLEFMSEDQTEIETVNGYTALSLAALAGETKIAKCLVGKNVNLLHITDGRDYIPLVAACSAGYKEVARYLYYVTPFPLLLPENGDQGYIFLARSIHYKIYDIALNALHRCPNMMTKGGELAPLRELTQTPSEYFTGSKLRFWQQWIYYCLNVKKRSVSSSNDHQVTINHEDLQEAMGSGELYRKSSMLLQRPGTKHLNAEIKRIYDLKLTHILARETQHFMCKQISAWGIGPYMDEVTAAIFKAIENGMVDFVIEMIKSNKRMLTTVKDYRGRSILMAAIAFRQEEIVNFICGRYASKSLLSWQDNDSNSLLHVAGQMAPTVQLHRISGAALQMQREVQWYKEVENIVYSKETKNIFGHTPYHVFTELHKPLFSKAEDWMKSTATCYTVVGALIITIMFAAAFTTPGGNNQAGFPIFINKTSFKIYIILDAISFFAASTSVLTFLGMLTSRNNIGDFHKYIPTKLVIGLSSLFISVVAMTIAFCSALFLMLQRRWWILIPCMLLASIPITLFVWLQCPLLVEIFNLTYRSPIFVRKRSVTQKAFFLKKTM